MTLRDIMQSISKGLGKVWKFATNDVWDIDIRTLSPKSVLGIKSVRVVYLVFKGFRDDECPLHAASLTYSTLMSIVPVLAISLALARGLGGAEAAKTKVQEAVNEWTQSFAVEATSAPQTPGSNATVTVAADGDPAVALTGDESAGLTSESLAEQINAMVEEGFAKVENISFAALGGVGLALLLWMVISVLGRVEGSFNRVWGVTEGRTIWRRFTDYLSILILLPILIIATTSLPVADYATRYLNPASADVVRDALGSDLLRRLTLTLMTTLCFGFTLMFMPNTKVRLGAGLAGGFVSGMLFIGWLMLCATIQVGAARYSRIYGSFAVVPIILAWVYVSWQIVLFGAEVAFAVQNCATYKMEQGSEKANFRSRSMLAMSLVIEAARRMLNKGGPLDVADYGRERHIPVRLLNEIVNELCHVKMFAPVAGEDGCYVLMRAPGSVKAADVLLDISKAGVDSTRLGLDSLEPVVVQVMQRVGGGIKEGLGELTIAQLVEGKVAA
jgi:membrane protein